MVDVKIGKVELLRAATALSVLSFFAVAPTFGFMYGTMCAFTFGSFTVVSPLELALLSLGTRTIIVSLIVPGLVSVLVIVFFGRFFCGWICPVGIILEYLHAFTDTKKRKAVGGLWKNWEKYAILLAVFAAALLFGFTAPYLFSPPSVVYRIVLSFISHGIVGADITVLFLIFVMDLIAIRMGRTWCNTVCPLGTVINSLSIINLVKPKVDQETCIDFDFNCLNCERTCPMRINVTRANRWTMMECNKCLKCWANCPTKAIKITV